MHALQCIHTPPPAHSNDATMWNVVLAIAERARSTGATNAERVRAIKAGMAERKAGRSQATAVAVGIRHLPSQRALRAVQ